MNQGYFLADKILNDYPDKAVLHWSLCISCRIFCVLRVFGCFYQGVHKASTKGPRGISQSHIRYISTDGRYILFLPDNFFAKLSTVIFAAERWQSGRMRRSWKPLTQKVRGFESLSLRWYPIKVLILLRFPQFWTKTRNKTRNNF